MLGSCGLTFALDPSTSHSPHVMLLFHPCSTRAHPPELFDNYKELRGLAEKYQLSGGETSGRGWRAEFGGMQAQARLRLRRRLCCLSCRRLPPLPLGSAADPAYQLAWPFGDH